MSTNAVMDAKRVRLGAGLFGLGLLLAACDNDAQVASRNLSKAADNFEIVRNIVFYNTMTDTEVVALLGRCSIEDQGNQLEVICKEAENEFKKHFLGRSENMTYFATQVEATDVSTFHTRITWKPQVFIPDIDIRESGEALVSDEDGN